MDLKRATQVKIENIEMLIVLELTDMPPYVLRWHKRIRTIQPLPEDSSLKESRPLTILNMSILTLYRSSGSSLISFGGKLNCSTEVDTYREVKPAQRWRKEPVIL